MDADEAPRALPRDRALTVYWQGQEEIGLLLYGLRRPEQHPEIDLTGLVAEGADVSEPWLLHGEGWAVDLWTIRTPGVPVGSDWRAMLERILGRLLDAGYEVAWFATEGDFVDPPGLFDPAVMGEGVYAAASRETGFLCRDAGEGDLTVLADGDLARLRRPATAVWSGGADE
jgi:hypothetical protein